MTLTPLFLGAATVPVALLAFGVIAGALWVSLLGMVGLPGMVRRPLAKGMIKDVLRAGDRWTVVETDPGSYELVPSKREKQSEVIELDGEEYWLEDPDGQVGQLHGVPFSVGVLEYSLTTQPWVAKLGEWRKERRAAGGHEVGWLPDKEEMGDKDAKLAILTDPDSGELITNPFEPLNYRGLNYPEEADLESGDDDNPEPDGWVADLRGIKGLIASTREPSVPAYNYEKGKMEATAGDRFSGLTGTAKTVMYVMLGALIIIIGQSVGGGGGGGVPLPIVVDAVTQLGLV